jgi:parvulin-like peptidyl-prolyl isomerase
MKRLSFMKPPWGNIAALTVYGQEVSLEELLRWMKIHQVTSMFEGKRDDLLLHWWQAENQIDISGDTLQTELEFFREERELYLEEELFAWMDDHGIGEEELVELLLTRIRPQLARASFTRQQVEAYYINHMLRFETVELYQLVTEEEGAALELRLQLEEESLPFQMLALEHSIDAQTKPACGYLGHRKREELRPEWEAAVFGAQEGQVVGPLQGELGYCLLLIARKHKPVLDEELEQIIREALYEEWLDDARKRAPVAYPLWSLLKKAEE